MRRQNTIKRLLHEQCGFTAAELLVAMALSAVAAVVIYSVFFSTRDSYSDTRDVANVQSSSRNAMSLLAQDLRSAGSNPRLTGAVQRLPLADAAAIRVQNDADGSGVINAIGEPAEDVAWSYDANTETVTRTTPQGAFTVLTNVTDLQFAYLDAAGNPLGPLPLTPQNRDLVRAVSVQLTARILDDDTRTWNTVFALRNDP